MLRFIIQQFPPLLISSVINLYFLKFDKTSNIICSLLAIMIIFGLHSAIFLMYQVVKNNTNKIESQEFNCKYGTILEGINVKKIAGQYWNVIILMRWSITITVLVCLRNLPDYQIIILLILSIFIECLSVRYKPLSDPLENKISLFNEFMVSIYLYLLLGLTDFNHVNPYR